MTMIETSTAQDLLNSFISNKKKLIAEKKIMDKKDKHIYPIKNTAFLIPEDWVWCYLSDLSIIQEGPGIRKHQYENEGVQFLTVTNILEGSVDLNKSKKYISISEYTNKYEHFTINKGDIVTACSGGSWGKSSFYDLDEKIILNTSTLRLRFFDDLGDNRYLYYLTKTSYFKGNLSSHSTGQQANYGYSHYSKIPIPLPPLPEQKQIVSILDKAFAAIDKAKASAEQNLKNAKELFESYLQNVFENKGDNWDEKKLGELCERVSVGYVGPTSKFYCDPSIGVPFIRSQNVRSGYLDWKGIQHVTKEFHNSVKKSQLKIEDILFVRVGAKRGDCCVLKEDIKELNCANIVFARLKTGNVDFIDRFCQSSVGKKQLLGMSVGAAQGVINTKSVAGLIIPYPPLPIQQTIVQKANSLSAETKKLEAIYTKKINDLEELKKSILQQAFSGKLTTN